MLAIEKSGYESYVAKYGPFAVKTSCPLLAAAVALESAVDEKYGGPYGDLTMVRIGDDYDVVFLEGNRIAKVVRADSYDDAVSKLTAELNGYRPWLIPAKLNPDHYWAFI